MTIDLETQITTITKFINLFKKKYKYKTIKDLQNNFHIKTLSNFKVFKIPKIKIECKKSNIHGYGVFAIEDIKINENITIYPIDILIIHQLNEQNDSILDQSGTTSHVNIIMQSDRYLEKKDKNITNNLLKQKILNNPYLVKVHINNQTISIIGDPNFKDDLNYVGHLINDGAKHNRNEKSKKIYNTISLIKMNCCIVVSDVCIYIKATRNINKGEELFLSYGDEYWYIY